MNLLNLILILVLITLFSVNAIAARKPFTPPKIKEIIENNVTHTLPIPEEKSDIHYLSYPLQYAEAELLASRLSHNNPPLLSKKGKIFADKQTNNLIFEDTQRHIERLQSWLKKIDIPQQQVQITAYIINTSREALYELGIFWELSSDKINQVGISRLNIHQPAPSSIPHIAFNIAKIKSHLLSLELSALEQENQLSIIASPRLMASHNHSASIKQGTEIRYIIQSKNKSQIKFKEAILGMEVTPTILRGGKVRLALKISQNTPNTSLLANTYQHIAINKQEISTQVTINHGETLILGGIFQQKKNNQQQKIPYLADIPFFGQLFTKDGKQTYHRELVIFITPQLINI